MATSMAKHLLFQTSIISRTFLINDSKRLLLVSLCKRYSLSHASEHSTVEGQSQDLTSDDLDDTGITRDISRMNKKYHNRMLHVMNPPPRPDYVDEMHETVSFKRRLYAKYGRKSGVDAGYLWPSADELNEQIEFEAEWEPTLKQMLENIRKEKAAEEKARKSKRDVVNKQMAKMPQLIKDYKQKLVKAEEQEVQQNLKRQALMDEARDYFGYPIDPRDERFVRLQEQKEEEEKKQKKNKKKEQKALKWLDAMKNLNQSSQK